MRYNLTHFFVLIFFLISSSISSSEMTLNELFFDNSKPYNLKIIEALPEKAIIQIGPDDAKNTVIEFMDYFCGYCKKIHPELLELAEERDDVRVIFLQHPILNQSSYLIAKMVIAANFQKKGLLLHNNIFSAEGSLNQEKLQRAINESNLNQVILKIDMEKEEVEKIIQLSSFLAGGIGARGTPSMFVNENFSPGYMSKQKIISLLK